MRLHSHTNDQRQRRALSLNKMNFCSTKGHNGSTSQINTDGDVVQLL